MPFTFSHPAIVLPLSYLPKRWVSLTGLVIGSLTPDFEYLLKMRIESVFGHTLVGLAWFDVPLGIILAFVFHDIVRNSLLDNLPLLLKARLTVFKQFDWNSYFRNNWLIVILSTLVGAASHLVWDGFTHNQAFFVQKIPGLSMVIEIFGRQVPILKLLQHSSTLVGGFVIAFALLRLPVDRNVKSSASFSYWSIVAMVAFSIILLRLLSGFDYKMYGHLIATSIATVLIGLIVTPLITGEVAISRRRDRV